MKKIDSMSISEWYRAKLESLNEAHQLALKGLKAELTKKRENCNHDWVRYEELFYALGNTCPGMRCSKCIAERNLTDEEKYPKPIKRGGWKVPWKKINKLPK